MRARALLPGAVVLALSSVAACTSLLGIDEDYRLAEDSGPTSTSATTSSGGMGGLGGMGGASTSSGTGGDGGTGGTGGMGGMGGMGGASTSSGMGGMGGASTSSGMGGDGGATTTSTSSGMGGDGGGILCTPFSTQTCYSGAPPTQGVGVCVAGTETCNAQGTGYGPCVGEVTPGVEDCMTVADENCDGLTPPCPGAHVWSHRGGDSAAQIGRAVAVDPAGAVYVGGQFNGTLSLSGGPTLQGNNDAFLVKLQADGSHDWSRSWGDSVLQDLRGVAATSAQTVVIGSFSGTMSFSGSCTALDTTGGAPDVFLAALDPSGACLWSKRFGNNGGAQNGTAVAVNANGEIAITGYFDGSIDFGCGSMTGEGIDIFVAKMGSGGNCIWSKRLGGAANSFGNGVAIDGAGNVFLAGHFDGTAYVDACTITSEGLTDGLVVKFDSLAGTCAGSLALGDAAANQYAFGIAVDASNNVLVTGGFDGTINDFGAGNDIVSAGMNDVFLAKLGPSLNHLWSKRFGDAADQNAYSVATGPGDRLAITGAFESTVNFGSTGMTALNSAGMKDIFVAVLDASAGGHLWSRRFGDGSIQIGNSVAIDASSHTLLTGSFAGAADFGGGTLTSMGADDLFVAKFLP